MEIKVTGVVSPLPLAPVMHAVLVWYRGLRGSISIWPLSPRLRDAGGSAGVVMAARRPASGRVREDDPVPLCLEGSPMRKSHVGGQIEQRGLVISSLKSGWATAGRPLACPLARPCESVLAPAVDEACINKPNLCNCSSTAQRRRWSGHGSVEHSVHQPPRPQSTKSLPAPFTSVPPTPRSYVPHCTLQLPPFLALIAPAELAACASVFSSFLLRASAVDRCLRYRPAPTPALPLLHPRSCISAMIAAFLSFRLFSLIRGA